MLVLTRRAGESVRIGSEVRVTVLSSAGGQVRIGIDAPARIAVHREEVFERIVASNLEAATVDEADLESWLPTPTSRTASRTDGEGKDS